MLPLFQDNFILGEATSSHFFRVTTSAQQLLFRGTYFFRTAAFFPFFRTVTFSQQLFFQNSFFFRAKILQSSHFLRIRSPLCQLLFGTAAFSLFRIKISKRALSSKQVLLHSINFFRKATFWKKLVFQKSNIPHYLLFLESCFFRAVTFSKDSTFYSSYLFKRATFLQHAFSEELLFHSYASFPQLHFLFIRQ